MAMNASALANDIASALGQITPTTEMTAWATGIVGEVSTGLVSHAVGTVTGTCPPGGPLANGAAANGTILGYDVSGAALASAVVAAAGYPGTSATLQTKCQIFMTYMATALVDFGSGDITGTCTNSAGSPGPLAAGAGTNGFIHTIDGTSLANLWHPVFSAQAGGFPGPTTKLLDYSIVIIDYIKNNAEVTYNAGSVTGTRPAGGGPLTNGTGIGGVIS